MVRLNLKFLGTFEVNLDEVAITAFRSKNIQGLLLYLCLHPGKPLDREFLATLFWPEADPKKSRENLRQSLATLNNAVLKDPQKEFIHANTQTITFNPDSNYRCDVHDFLEAVRTGDLQAAAEFYTGKLAPNLAVTTPNMETWVEAEREHLHNQAQKVLEQLTIEYLSQANFVAAEQSARRLIELEPLLERGHRLLMMALAKGGSRNGALRHFESLSLTLLENLALDPEPATKQIYQQIKNNEPFHLPQPIPKHSIDKKRDLILDRLEVLPDQKLFGVHETLEKVIAAISSINRPWLVSIDGLGGIGKTTLGNEVVHHFLNSDRFLDIAWVSAKQEQYITGRGIQETRKPALNSETLLDHLLAQLADGPYPTTSFEAKRSALKQILREKTSLVVVDNLETVADYEELLPLLRYLSQPSKILITSRMSLRNESDIYCQSLSELKKIDSIAFLKHEANNQQIQILLKASNETFNNIYQTIGGNPLALKMVLGQAHYLSLEQILRNMILAKGKSVDELYKYIYWQAWHMLDNESKQLLVSLPLSPNGTLQQIQRKSQLTIDQVLAAVNNLHRLSLVEFSVSTGQPRYHLHRLTETFLLNEVLRWQRGSEAEPEEKLFKSQLKSALTEWQESDQTADLKPADFDAEHDAILQTVQFSLDHDPYWPHAKKMILVLGSFMERRGQLMSWLSIIEKAIEVADRLYDHNGALEMANLRGRILQRTGNESKLRQNYRQVIRRAKKAKNQIEEARACSNLGYSFVIQGFPWRAEILNQHALAIFATHEHKHGQAHTHNHLGLLYTHTKDFDHAEHHLQIACDIWRGMDDEFGLINGLANLAYLYIKMDRPAESIVILEKALEIGQKRGEKGYLLAINLMNLGIAHRMLSNFAEATHFSEEAEKIYKDNGNQISLYHVWENFGHIKLGLGELSRAIDYFEAAHEGYSSQSQVADSTRVEEVIRGLKNEKYS